jgi:predicted secreted hydrolase
VSRLIGLLLLLLLSAPAPAADYPVVKPGRAFAFPADHGAHPAFRTEWWYATGWITTASGEQLGFQITFFRSRTGLGEDNPSRFAPRQLIFAHAALSDARLGRLRHSQRIARAGFGLAEAATGDMRLVLDDWSMRRLADGRITAKAAGSDFALDLVMQPSQPPLLQGQAGYSRKGPDPAEASHYYTLPQLRVSGHVEREGRREAVTGTAWLDREWSSTLLNPQASGWDWLGLNLDDGGALTLFRVRHRDGRALWAGGSWRSREGRLTVLGPDDVRFEAARHWRSPRTGARYPVAPVVTVRLPGGERRIPVTPLMDDQELDSRKGGGPVYWEGAVRVPGGRGYLEMTGYLEALRM